MVIVDFLKDIRKDNLKFNPGILKDLLKEGAVSPWIFKMPFE